MSPYDICPEITLPELATLIIKATSFFCFSFYPLRQEKAEEWSSWASTPVMVSTTASWSGSESGYVLPPAIQRRSLDQARQSNQRCRPADKKPFAVHAVLSYVVLIMKHIANRLTAGLAVAPDMLSSMGLEAFRASSSPHSLSAGQSSADWKGSVTPRATLTRLAPPDQLS